MHYAISTTWGPTDTTRASLPFIFAASALQAGDTVMIMLFHDAVTVAVEGAHPKMVPFGPPQKFEEVFSNPDAKDYCLQALRRGTRDYRRYAGCQLYHWRYE